MATAIRLYQRLDSTQRYRLTRVQYSRNGSPVADPPATAFYLRYRLKDGRRICLPAGSDVLEADHRRKVLEARIATGSPVPTTADTTVAAVAAATDRKAIVAGANAYIERTRKSKKAKTYKGYKDAVELFVTTCKKAQTVFSTFMKVLTFPNDCHVEKHVETGMWIQRKDRPVNVAKRNARNKKYPVYTEDAFTAMLAVADKAEYALLYFIAGSG